MPSSSLESASSYLNNLLLARGLLQDGKPIEFAEPSQNGNSDATMARVINLVHELVLRRDRDADQRESLASTIRVMRSDQSQRLLDLQKLQEKNGELSRNLTTAEAQQRTLKASVQRAETQAKDLKEQMLKMKSTLDQVRAKCISDVRKRDMELDKLKTHLSSMQRGRREASGMKVNIINTQASRGRDAHAGQNVDSTDWSLEKETNDFLAAIVNETSSENVTLRSLISSTMDTLRDLTGFETEPEEVDDAIGIPGQYRQKSSSESITPCSALDGQMTAILAHCQTILKDPSFVPIEEVQVRDEEIIKLRIGWEKMAGRWKEAVTMMTSWRQKMLEGDQMDADELNDFSFGRSIAVMPNGDPVLGADDEASSMLYADKGADEEDIHNGAADIRFDEESDLDLPPTPSPKRLAASPARRGIKLQPLQEMSNTRASKPIDSSLSLDGILDENTRPVSSTRSKIPRQPSASRKSPPMTVGDKLAAVEAEAKAAESRRRQDATQKRKATAKAKKVDKGRRRSTLSPDELAGLMGVR
jgi:hypothetical protein